MLRSIGRILLVRDQGASPCVDSCIILETGAREGRKRRRRRRKRRKKWMDLVLLFFCCESRRSRVDLSPRGFEEMAVDISESFSTSHVDERLETLLLPFFCLFYRRTHEDAVSLREIPRCWKNVHDTLALEPFKPVYAISTITLGFPSRSSIAFHFLSYTIFLGATVFLFFLYRRILLAERGSYN